MSKTLLIIMDGWGIGDGTNADAIAQAHTPFVSGLYTRYPHCRLRTCGTSVGLPAGQMGNSEVGHLNIGAGRIVYQSLQRINKAIETGELTRSEILHHTLTYLKKNNCPLHLMGLIGTGGVHAHQSHLHFLMQFFYEAGVRDIRIHAFTDGRDSDPHAGERNITDLQVEAKKYGAKIVSIMGRYFAMDRDERKERTKTAYDALCLGVGREEKNPVEALRAAYARDESDEFLKPIILDKTKTIKAGDAVLCFNFRTDRCRQIMRTLTEGDPAIGKALPLYAVTMTRYDDKFENIKVIFEKETLVNTLGDVLAKENKKQLRAAETEKYPHVTFFFNGGEEQKFSGEERLLIPSPKVATYDLQPAMSAPELTQKVLTQIEKNTFDFICVNFANADMVGHTGVFEAAVAAVETVDAGVCTLSEKAQAHGYYVLITADHGNADIMLHADGTPCTTHTLNPVPFFLCPPITDHKKYTLQDGILADIAPTILELMHVPPAQEMTGRSLIANTQ